MDRCVYNGYYSWVGRNASPEFWDALWKESFEKRLKTTKVPVYLRSVLKRVPPEGRILEAGCGGGGVLNAIKKEGFPIEGIDNADESINLLTEFNLPVKKMDVRKLDYADNEFSCYLSLGVIEHFLDISDARKVIEEAFRVVKPGGILFFSVPYLNIVRKNKMEGMGHESADIEHFNFWQRAFSSDQLMDLFKNLDMTPLEMGYSNPLKGIGDEVQWLHFIKTVKLIAKPISIIDTYTPVFNWGAHMISVTFVSNKDNGY
jgi:SAM-dependent methyltransferase